MTRHSTVKALRQQLAELVAKPGPTGQRGREMWPLAEQIAAATGEPVRAVFDRAVKDAVAAQMRRAFP